MRIALLIISLVLISGCKWSAFDKAWYEKITGIKFPGKYEVVETADNVEFVTIAVLKMDEKTLKQFVLENHFDSAKNVDAIQLIGEYLLNTYKLNLQSVNNVFVLSGTSKISEKNDWKYIADLNKGTMWVQVLYPDWGGK